MTPAWRGLLLYYLVSVAELVEERDTKREGTK